MFLRVAGCVWLIHIALVTDHLTVGFARGFSVAIAAIGFMAGGVILVDWKQIRRGSLFRTWSVRERLGLVFLLMGTINIYADFSLSFQKADESFPLTVIWLSSSLLASILSTLLVPLQPKAEDWLGR